MHTLHLVFLFACTESPERGESDAPTYGDEELSAEEWADPDVSCAVETDCLSGEICTEGVCRVDRCDETYDSVPPLGEDFLFFMDREVAVADANSYEGDFYIDGYQNSDRGVEYEYSWNTGV